ncbi:MAG: aspartate ammonia-lyase [Candidatus Bathyarchaeia archaeon]
MSEKALVGVAGVHFVVAELSRRDWIALPTIRNTRGIDVLASKDGCFVEIQVKTRRNGRHWVLHESTEKLIRDNLFYVLVNLRENETPEYFILPSKIVAEYVARTHKLFLQQGGQNSTMRKIPNTYGEDLDNTRLENKFKDRWDLLASWKMGVNHEREEC